MLRGNLHRFGPVYVASAVLILSYSARRFVKSSGRSSEDKISALPDDLLVKILLLLPTKDAVATVILSKRWKSVWTMLPQLIYQDSEYKQRRGKFFLPKKKQSIWWFLDQSLQLHKAPVLQSLVIELGPICPVSCDVRKCLANAVNRRVRSLEFQLGWLSEPSSLPESLYTCNTLVSLTISDKIFVDVPCTVCLPSLEYLCLVSVVYKNEDALVRLLSGCPVLKKLRVQRRSRDNLKHVSVRMPSLKTLIYDDYTKRMGGSLLIDSAALINISHRDGSGNSYSIENKPRLKRARLQVFCYLDDKIRRSLSWLIYLDFILSPATVACCKAINFSQLTTCTIYPYNLDWLEPFMCFLQNSPKLKVLYIDQVVLKHENFPLSFNPPSSVPGCLSHHLEILEWVKYGGRNGEKDVVRYILANSKCLKRAGISIEPNCSDKIRMELESMSRFSTSSQLLFSNQFVCKTPFQYDFPDEV